ncbi:MAG: DUF5777 family beta-barrel protein [Acidobacteriota bacterium]
MRTTTSLIALIFLFSSAAFSGQDEQAAFAPVAGILKYRCAASGCHTGPDPKRGMRLHPDQVREQTVLVRSASDESFIRIVPGHAEQSLLYLKLLPKKEGGYPGKRMPYGEDPLSEEEIALVRRWIESLPADDSGPAAATAPPVSPPRTFFDSHLVNLPTSDPLGKGRLEFRILHRFKAPALEVGGGQLYGLDSGAWISFGLAYGLSDSFELGLRRTNLQTDYEAYAKGTLLRQREDGIPLSVAVRGGVSSSRNEIFANRTRWSGQVVLARRFGKRLSLLVVPTYVTRTNSERADDEGDTAAVGVGGELHLTNNMALTAEWVGQTAGVKAPFETVSVGFSMATSRHVFQIVATNTRGTHTDLYVPGGDIDPEDDFRLGFNITRIFSLR